LTFLKVNNFNNLIKLSLGGGKNMTKKELQEQNKQLKATIEKMERRIVRLKARINDLQKIAAIGRRGLPWR
jgi:cell division protein FtsB